MKWPRLRGLRLALPIAPPGATRGMFVSLVLIGVAASLLASGYAVFTASDSDSGTITASDTFISPYAIFGMMEECPSDEGVSWTGSDGNVVKGRVHTNSTFKLDGSNNSFNDEVTYVCEAVVGGSGHTFADGPNQVETRAIALPVSFDDIFPDECDELFASSVTLTGSDIVSGNVYCADGDIQLSISNTTAIATFVARGKIHVSGTNINLKSAHSSGVLFLSADDADDAIVLDIQVSGSRSVFGGMQAAPRGRIDYSSNDVTVNGCLIAQIVHIAGNDTVVDAKHADAFACADIVEGTVSVAVDDLAFFEVDSSGNITTTPCGPAVPGDICRAVGNVTYTGTLEATLEVEGSFDETLSGCFDVSGTIDTTALFQVADPDFGPVPVMEGDAFAYGVDVELPSTAGNECQGQTVTVTIDATATSS